ncbi:hypothetical protein HJC23_004365 [Cyclotella cryptica]|uniref:Uncharacterized protein n=1 Tax=Cyclotella cryptica TaxID=29204 RepID=A0ABD3PGR6_9STRA|eukprot:CCRYP_014539-RA/>CCRYP_014539-RA protein AED:0.00 eAED:0.00 QI:140/-1/1/1/-1/1/1/190/643
MLRSSSASSLSTGATGLVSSKSTKSATLAYLQSYETMVRMQDDEAEKTSDFLRGALERIRFLGRRSEGSSSSVGNNHEDAPEGMLTYLEMRRCLLRLGYTWNRSLPQSAPGASSRFYDDDAVSIASGKSSSSRVSGASGRVIGGKRKKRDVLTTDSQLIMLMSILVEMEERHRVEKMAIDTHQPDEDKHCSRGLFWPELIQAYKLVIGGMQSLQALDNGLSNGNSNGFQGADLSERLRERTKCLLRSFGPHQTMPVDVSLFSPPSIRSNSGKSRDGLSSPSKQLFTSPSRTSSKKSRAKSITDAGLSQPRLADENVRKLMHNKDSALAKIVEEHESEMNAMASSMEALKAQEISSRSALADRRKKARIALVALTIIVFAITVYWEHQRRLWVHRQIALGREAERLKSAEEIERLSLQRDGLRHKLNTLEGTARYQHSRLVELESSTNSTLNEIAELEQKWWIDQAEMGRCHLSLREMEADFTKLKNNIDEIEEEQGWCLNRLQGREAELNSLQFARIGDDDIALSRSDVRALTVAATSATEKPKTEKPVKLEMKYNRSVRNAMMLRQVYSGLGGVAASVIFRGVFPGFFSFLSATGGAVAPTATTAVAAAPKKFFMNIKWVDRIHAATVVLLVVRTAVLFFFP